MRDAHWHGGERAGPDALDVGGGDAVFLQGGIAQENFLPGAASNEPGQGVAFFQLHVLQHIIGVNDLRGAQDLVEDLLAIESAPDAGEVRPKVTALPLGFVAVKAQQIGPPKQHLPAVDIPLQGQNLRGVGREADFACGDGLIFKAQEQVAHERILVLRGFTDSFADVQLLKVLTLYRLRQQQRRLGPSEQ